MKKNRLLFVGVLLMLVALAGFLRLIWDEREDLMWPVIFIAILLVFWPAVAAFLETARSRKFTFKIGGQEITMEEANHLQQNLIADLQAQVVDLRKRMNALKVEQPLARAGSVQQETRNILWVDDNPKNNSYFAEELIAQGITIDLALSTEDALRLACNTNHDLIISDMGRQEQNRRNPTAGLDLLERLKITGNHTPVIIFCSQNTARKYKDRVIELGARAIISSPIDLYAALSMERARLSAG